MDNTYHTTEHRKGQHLLSEERHEIEVRRKDGWSIYRIAKHLGRPYNTIKNEIKRGTVSLYNGKVRRYKADEGETVYLERRQNCRRQYRCLAIDTLIVRNPGKQSIEQCGFTGGGSARNDKGHAVSDAGFKETEHFLRQCVCADEVVPVHSLRVQFTDADGNRAFFIDHGLFHRRDSGVIRQMSLC